MSSTSRPLASSVAVFYQNSVLLGKRIEHHEGKPIPLGGYWSVFGGMIEEGESLKEAACRELQEETTILLEPSVLCPLTVLHNHGVSYNIYAYHACSLVLPVLNFEHTEYGWFKAEDLTSFPYLIDESLVEALHSYISDID